MEYVRRTSAHSSVKFYDIMVTKCRELECGTVMKKFSYVSLGIAIGVMLTLASNAYGSELKSLVGKKVQSESEVLVEGVKLDTAIIIDGKSYAPVRSIGEVAGFLVDFKDKKITLEKKQLSSEDETISEGVVGEVMTDIERVETQIDSVKSSIESLQYMAKIKTNITEEEEQMVQKKLSEYYTLLTELEKKKAELEIK